MDKNGRIDKVEVIDERQVSFGCETLQDYQYDFIMSKEPEECFSAGWGTGKTMCALFKCLKLIQEHPGDSSVRASGNLIAVIRNNVSDLRRSTIKDFKLYTGLKCMEWKEQEKEAYFPEYGGTIMFLHADELGALQNMNLGAVFWEQADEMEDDGSTYDFLAGRLRRKNTSRQIFLTCNATDKTHWIYQYFKNPETKIPNGRLFEASSYDNASNLPKDTFERWERMKLRNPAMFKRFVLNMWGVSAHDFSVYTQDLLDKLPSEIIYPFHKKIISIDPSLGGDECVLQCIENYKVVDEKALLDRDTMKIASEGAIFGDINGCENFIVDVIGVGRGVGDRLVQLKKNVQMFQSSESAETEKKFVNKRAEAYWLLREMMEQKEIPRIEHPEIERQLLSHRYKMTSRGLIRIEDKGEIRKRLMRSPDNADTFVMGVYGLKNVKDMSKRERWWRKREPLVTMGGYMSV